MAAAFFQFLADQPFVTVFFVLGFGHLVGRLRIGSFSPGSTAGALLVALLVGALAFQTSNVRFQIPDLLQTTFLALFTYAVGLRVGPQFVEGLQREGFQLIVLVLVTTTVGFAISFGGSVAAALPPGYAPGILSGGNTISAVMGVATAAVDQGLYQVPAGQTAEQIKANIAAGYSLSYILSILGGVLLIRNLPGMFGIDPVAAAKKSEEQFGATGHALPGTSEAFTLGIPKADIRVFKLTSTEFTGRPASLVFDRLDTPVLRITRAGARVPLEGDPALQSGDVLTVGGRVDQFIITEGRLGPDLADAEARDVEIDQAEIVLTNKTFVGMTLGQLHADRAAYGVRIRALFRDTHELPLLPATPLRRHDVLRVIGPAEAVRRMTAALGQAVRPTSATDIITLAFGIATGYAAGLATVSVAGIPVGLGSMGGVVVAGMIVSTLRAVNPRFGGPMPEGARGFLESIGVDLFVVGLGLNVAPALVSSLSEGTRTVVVILLGIATSVVPSFVSWLVGLYILKMDPIVLAGAVAGARNSTTSMRAISDRARSAIPAFGYPVTYALSTVVFLIYGYLSMLLS